MTLYGISGFQKLKVKQHWMFAVSCFIIILIAFQTVQQLFRFSIKHEFASMIPIMPFMSAALFYRSRSRIFERLRSSSLLGSILLVFGTGLLVWAGNELSIKAAGIICLIFGAFLISYGSVAFQRALFPLLMLLFMIPIPEVWLEKAILILQQGSAEGAAILFSLTGTPYHREGLSFLLPRTSIEIAPECSSIRSSLALLISCLLAGYLMLRTISSKFILVLVAIPMAMVKNAIRIVTLSLLAIHVDMGYLAGSDLHRKGGIVFFMLTLLLMWPVLWILRKTEKAPRIARINIKE